MRQADEAWRIFLSDAGWTVIVSRRAPRHKTPLQSAPCCRDQHNQNPPGAVSLETVKIKKASPAITTQVISADTSEQSQNVYRPMRP